MYTSGTTWIQRSVFNKPDSHTSTLFSFVFLQPECSPFMKGLKPIHNTASIDWENKGQLSHYRQRPQCVRQDKKLPILIFNAGHWSGQQCVNDRDISKISELTGMLNSTMIGLCVNELWKILLIFLFILWRKYRFHIVSWNKLPIHIFNAGHWSGQECVSMDRVQGDSWDLCNQYQHLPLISQRQSQCKIISFNPFMIRVGIRLIFLLYWCWIVCSQLVKESHLTSLRFQNKSWHFPMNALIFPASFGKT